VTTSVTGDHSNYESLMTVHDLINALYETGDQDAKVFLGITTPAGNNPRTKCGIQAVHGAARRLPAVEIVGQPIDDQAESGGSTDVADLAEQIRKQDDALDELVMSAELATVYRDDRAVDRLRKALAGWREASGDPR
jgi:hypothetical protein